MADPRRRNLSRLSGRTTGANENKRLQSQTENKNRRRIWHMPGFWMILLLAGIAFIVTVLNR